MFRFVLLCCLLSCTTVVCLVGNSWPDIFRSMRSNETASRMTYLNWDSKMVSSFKKDNCSIQPSLVHPRDLLVYSVSLSPNAIDLDTAIFEWWIKSTNGNYCNATNPMDSDICIMKQMLLNENATSIYCSFNYSCSLLTCAIDSTLSLGNVYPPYQVGIACSACIHPMSCPVNSSIFACEDPITNTTLISPTLNVSISLVNYLAANLSATTPSPTIDSFQMTTIENRTFVNSINFNVSYPEFNYTTPGFNNSVTHFNYTMPSFNNSMPGYNNSMPGYNYSMPGYNNSMPGYNNSMPGYNYSMPGYNYSMPGYNYSMPGYNYSMPGYNYSMPGFNNSMPEYNYSMPGFNKSMPGYNYSTPGYNFDNVTGIYEQDLITIEYNINQTDNDINDLPKYTSVAPATVKPEMSSPESARDPPTIDCEDFHCDMGVRKLEDSMCVCDCNPRWTGNACNVYSFRSIVGYILNFRSPLSLFHLSWNVIRENSAGILNQYCMENEKYCCPLGFNEHMKEDKFIDDDDLIFGKGFPIEVEVNGVLYTKSLILANVSEDNCILNYRHQVARQRRSLTGEDDYNVQTHIKHQHVNINDTKDFKNKKTDDIYVNYPKEFSSPFGLSLPIIIILIFAIIILNMLYLITDIIRHRKNSKTQPV